MYRSRSFVRAMPVALFFMTPLSAAMAQVDMKLESYRSQVMAGLSANMHAIGMIVNGTVKFSDAVGDMILADLAVAIAGPSRSLLQLYPDKMKASGGEEARQIMPPFREVAGRFNGEAARLVQIAPSRNQDAIAAQYKALDEAFQALAKETGTAPAGTAETGTATTGITPAGATPSAPEKPAPPAKK